MIVLSGKSRLYTDDASSSYKIIEGSVQVFFSPSNESGGKRQMFLMNADKDFIVPHLNMLWGFGEKQSGFKLLLIGNPTAKIEKVPAELQHDVDFLKAAGIETMDEPSPDLLGDTLIMYYSSRNVNERKIVEDISDRRSQQTTDSVQRFADSFESSFVGKHSANAKTESALYNAASFACNLSKIPIVSLDNLKQNCKNGFSMADIARGSGFVCREIHLAKNWASEDMDPFVVLLGEEQTPLACYRHFGRIHYWNPQTNEEGILKNILKNPEESRVFIICRPLASGKETAKSILAFAASEIRPVDIIIYFGTMFLSTFVTLQMTILTERLYNEIIPQGSLRSLAGAALYIIAFMIGGLMFNISKSLANFRISSRIKYALQAAAYDRLFHMKYDYFRNRTVADISFRVESMPSTYVSMLTSAIQIVGTVVFSFMYLDKMMKYSSKLTLYAVIFIVINIVFSMVLGFVSQKTTMKRTSARTKIRGLLLQTFSGIGTIRSYGSERDFSNRFMNAYSDYNQVQMEGDFVTRLQTMILSAASYAAIVFFYVFMAQGNLGISTGIFLAFISAYSAYSASMMSVARNVLMYLLMRPMLKTTSDIFNEVPETAVKGVNPGDLKGEILISNVSFGYRKGEAPVLNNISLKIPKGQYVALVGPSGCGKSTLLKLMLGFETPSRGKIYYDGMDLDRLNKVELRRKIGTVMQDGALFSGSIYKNISIASPNASQQDVLDAAEAANLTETIQNMPLGFSTPVSEQSESVSGGQKQRILIARAIVSKPKVLFMDEATSALDNISQAVVQQNLDKLNATRVVIAHRLSTVQNCDVIYVMNKGSIVESGSYAELMEKKGFFYTLVQKQVM